MPKVGIVVDSTCDVSPADLAARDIRHIPLIVRFGTEEYRDAIDLTPDEFYAKLAAATDLPKTSQPTPADFMAAYRELAADGCDEIVVLTLSEPLSGTHQSADIASKDSPVPIHLVNTKNVSCGLGMLAFRAAELRADGLDGAAIAQEILRLADLSTIFVVVGQMDNLVKGGRAGRAAGLAASLLNIKPILTIGSDGLLEPAGKVRGMSKAIEQMAKLLAEKAEPLGEVRWMMVYTTDESLAEQAREAIKAAGVRGEEQKVGRVGPVVGTYVGEGTIAVGYIPVA